MRYVLLAAAGLIATAAVSTPAAAQSGAAAGFTGVSAHRSGHVTTWGSSRGNFDRRRDGRRHRDRDFDDVGFLPYDREYQGDTVWRAESYNDWWHSRPERSYPAWMSRNQNCERKWWSGGGWRC